MVFFAVVLWAGIAYILFSSWGYADRDRTIRGDKHERVAGSFNGIVRLMEWVGMGKGVAGNRNRGPVAVHGAFCGPVDSLGASEAFGHTGAVLVPFAGWCVGVAKLCNLQKGSCVYPGIQPEFADLYPQFMANLPSWPC